MQGSPPSQHGNESVADISRPLVSILTKTLRDSQPASTTASAASSTQSPRNLSPPGEIAAHSVEVTDLVRASQAAAAWAEACQLPRDRYQAVLATFWAAYLHTLVAHTAYQVAAFGIVAQTDSQQASCIQQSYATKSVLNVETHHQLNEHTDVPSLQSEVSKACLQVRTVMANLADESVALAEEYGFPNRWTFKERVQGKAVDEWKQCHELFVYWPWDTARKTSLKEFTRTATRAGIMCERAAQELLYITRMPSGSPSQVRITLLCSSQVRCSIEWFLVAHRVSGTRTTSAPAQALLALEQPRPVSPVVVCQYVDRRRRCLDHIGPGVQMSRLSGIASLRLRVKSWVVGQLNG